MICVFHHTSPDGKPFYRTICGRSQTWGRDPLKDIHTLLRMEIWMSGVDGRFTERARGVDRVCQMVSNAREKRDLAKKAVQTTNVLEKRPVAPLCLFAERAL